MSLKKIIQSFSTVIPAVSAAPSAELLIGCCGMGRARQEPGFPGSLQPREDGAPRWFSGVIATRSQRLACLAPRAKAF